MNKYKKHLLNFVLFVNMRIDHGGLQNLFYTNLLAL